MIRRVTHGQHAFGQDRITLGKKIILKEVLLDYVPAAQAWLDAGSEVAVTEPSGPFAVRAVHEDIDSVLAEGFAPGCKETVQARVG